MYLSYVRPDDYFIDLILHCNIIYKMIFEEKPVLIHKHM